MSTINWIGLYTMVRREVERTFRVVVQTLVSPVMSATLYIFIFGTVIGSKIETIAGKPYITFVFPGILMLSVINAAFASASSSLYFARFTKSIEELLVSPFSYFELIIGQVFGAMFRAVLVSFLVVIVGIFFGAVTLAHPFFFVLYIFGVGGIFALLGLLVALWARGFEQLTVLNTFIITPFTYLGGIFYSITMLSPTVELITKLNPFFYFIDGIRFSMIDLHEGSLSIGAVVIGGLFTGLTLLILHLYKIGWHIRV
jgi:ABC-2 type transport system permease protein